MPRRQLALLLLLGACNKVSVPLLPPPREGGDFKALAFYEGQRPRQADAAILVLLTPPGGSNGLGVVTSVRDAESGREERRLARRVNLLEMKPGRVEVQVYFWIQRSRFERSPTGDRELVIESMRSVHTVPLTVDAEKGKTYYIDPELRRKGRVPASRRGEFHEVIRGKNVSQTPSPPPDEYEVVDDYLWRPRLKELKGDEAARYRKYGY